MFSSILHKNLVRMLNSFQFTVLIFIHAALSCLTHEAVAAAQNMSVDFNPDCNISSLDEDECNKPWLVHISPSSGEPQDVEHHHLWGGVGAPTFIALQTRPNSSISVDWDALNSSEPLSVQVTPQPYNIFGVSIADVILFDDAHDKGSIKNVEETAQIWLPSSLFTWDYKLNSTPSRVHFSLFATAFNGTEFEPNSRLYLNVIGDATGFRADERPQLYCPSSAAAVDLILDHLILNVTNPHPSNYTPHEGVPPMSGFNSPRYAVRLVLFSSESRTSSLVHASDRSLDDEYAPGIFKLDSVTTERARAEEKQPEGGYLQWRPVSYLSKEDRDVNNATLPTLSLPPANSSLPPQTTAAPTSDSPFDLLSAETPSDVALLTSISDSLKQSLAYALMGDNLTDLLAAHTLVSFGEPEDGYYTSSLYTVWSFTGGSGSPPSEGLSTNVLIVIIVGLGLPVLAMMIAGVSLVVWKNSKRNRNDHVALLNEET